MKTIFIIIISVVVAIFVNYMLGGNAVTVEHFNKRINIIESKIDSIDLKIKNLQLTADTIKNDTKHIRKQMNMVDAKVDTIKSVVKEIKTTANKIEFKLF